MSCINLFVTSITQRKTPCRKCNKDILKGEKSIRGIANLGKNYHTFHKKCYEQVLKSQLKELRSE